MTDIVILIQDIEKQPETHGPPFDCGYSKRRQFRCEKCVTNQNTHASEEQRKHSPTQGTSGNWPCHSLIAHPRCMTHTGSEMAAATGHERANDTRGRVVAHLLQGHWRSEHIAGEFLSPSASSVVTLTSLCADGSFFFFSNDSARLRFEPVPSRPTGRRRCG